MNELPLDRFTVDKAFYGALKLHVYGTVHDSFLTTLMGGRSITLNETLRLDVGRFTARKADNLFVPQNGSKPKQSAEFYGFTSHKVREKLLAFHEAGIVELLGKGLRDAYTYKWKLPVKHWEVCSYMRFRDVSPDDPSLNLEMYRLYLDRAFAPFEFREFHTLYAAAHEAEYTATRWGKRKFEKMVSSFQYDKFLKSRLDKMVQAGHVVADGATFSLNPERRDALNHIDLFFNAVPYHPSRDMCSACALDDLCQAGSTQKLILSLNAKPVGGATQNGTADAADS